MANYDILTIQSGKRTRLPSDGATIDFVGVRIGASNLAITEDTGALDFGAVVLKNMSTTAPSADGDIANKKYVDDQIGGASGTLTGLTDTTIATPASAHMLLWDGTDSWDNKAISGDITISNAGVTAIGSGVIVNDDVKSDAAIVESKLSLDYATGTLNTAIGNLTHDGLTGFEAGEHFTMLDQDGMDDDDATKAATQQSIKAYVDAQVSSADTLAELTDTTIAAPASGHMLLWDGTDSWDNKAMSGAITISSTGATGLSEGAVDNFAVNASAGIVESKLSLDYATGTLNTAIGNLTHDGLTGFEAGEHFTMLDQDGMDDDDATKAATQQSIKAYVDAHASGATVALDNLASVAINTNLISDTALEDDLGSAAIPWNILHTGNSYWYSAANTAKGAVVVDFTTGGSEVAALSIGPWNAEDNMSFGGFTEELPGDSTGLVIIESGYNTSAAATSHTGNLIFRSGATAGTGVSTTGHVQVSSGNASTGTGDSGDISLQTGTSSGGARGDIVLNGLQINASTSKIINVVDPTADQHAATKKYVDDNIGGVATTLSGLTDTTIAAPATAHMLLWDGSNSWDNKAISGDISINASGVTAIASGVIVNGDVKSDAAIVESKLSLDYSTSGLNTAIGNLTHDGFGDFVANEHLDWTASVGTIHVGNIPTGIPAASVGGGTIDNTEFGYLNGVTSAIQTQINALDSGYNRRRAIIDYIADNTADPTAMETEGNRYILSHDGGAPHAGYDGAAVNDIVEFLSGSWVATTPSEGWVCYDDTANSDRLQIDDGTPQWELRSIQSNALADGKIWAGNGSGLAAAVTMSGDVTMTNAGVTSIGGTKVTAAMLNADVVGNGMTGGGGSAVAVSPDVTETSTTLASAINVDGNGVAIKVDDRTIEGDEQGVAGAENLAVKMGAALTVDNNGLSAETSDFNGYAGFTRQNSGTKVATVARINTGYDTWLGMNATTVGVGQSFYTVRDVDASKVSVLMYRTGTLSGSAKATMKIYDEAWSVVGTSDELVLDSTIGINTDVTETYFTFTTKPALIAGTTYIFGIYYSTVGDIDGSNYINIAYQSVDQVAGVQRYTSGNTGSTWTGTTGDLWYSVHGEMATSWIEVTNMIPEYPQADSGNWNNFDVLVFDDTYLAGGGLYGSLRKLDISSSVWKNNQIVSGVMTHGSYSIGLVSHPGETVDIYVGTPVKFAYMYAGLDPAVAGSLSVGDVLYMSATPGLCTNVLTGHSTGDAVVSIGKVLNDGAGNPEVYGSDPNVVGIEFNPVFEYVY